MLSFAAGEARDQSSLVFLLEFYLGQIVEPIISSPG